MGEKEICMGEESSFYMKFLELQGGGYYWIL
jgi:hypothetical protein